MFSSTFWRFLLNWFSFTKISKEKQFAVCRMEFQVVIVNIMIFKSIPPTLGRILTTVKLCNSIPFFVWLYYWEYDFENNSDDLICNPKTYIPDNIIHVLYFWLSTVAIVIEFIIEWVTAWRILTYNMGVIGTFRDLM